MMTFFYDLTGKIILKEIFSIDFYAQLLFNNVKIDASVQFALWFSPVLTWIGYIQSGIYNILPIVNLYGLLI